MSKDPLIGKELEEHDRHMERLRDLYARSRSNTEEIRKIVEEKRDIGEALKKTSRYEDERAVLLSRTQELQGRIERALEESSRLDQERSEREAEREQWRASMDERLEDIRTAALETEKMFFEVGKLIATLDVAIIVAMAAVAPSIFPDLESLRGLWPAFGWLFGSVVASIVLCIYSLSQVSQLLARVRRKRRSWSWLPNWVPRLLRLLPQSVIITFSVGGLLIGIGRFALFVSSNMG